MKFFCLLGWIHILLLGTALWLCDGDATVMDMPLRPTIGILSQGTSPSYKKYGASYITASYVKYVESAGARAVPIFVNQTDEYYANIVKSVNGILFPGGGADIIDSSSAGYAGAAASLYKLAMQANKNGDHFPIWGTCLGFEALIVLTAGKNVLKAGFDSHNISLPVCLQPGYEDSKILNKNSTPLSIIKTLTTRNSTFNSHRMGLTPANFSKFAPLKSFFRVLSTNFDLNGVEFISMVEAYDYPFYGSQWHPEKNPYEWKVEACRSGDCVQLTQFMANFFVDEARKNTHEFSSVEELNKHLIYNYLVTNLSQSSSSFEQAYFFN